MNDHTTALVPLETWAYHSPTLRRGGHVLDVGLFAEALLYYDRVIVVPATEPLVGWVQGSPPVGDHRRPATPLSAHPQFLELVNWFVQRESLGDFIALLKDRTVRIYHYAFNTFILRNVAGAYMIWNAQDSEQAAGPTFERRVMGHSSLYKIVKRARIRARLSDAVRGGLIEVHSTDFDRAVENGRRDFGDGDWAGLAAQAIADEVYGLLGLNEPPIVATTAQRVGDITHFTWNLDFSAVDRALGPFVNFSVPILLAGLAHSNRTIWSAALETCDLYLPSPMSRIAGTKLYEAQDRRMRPQETMGALADGVEFPDVRSLVNSGTLSFPDVLKIRNKAKRFRTWLQTQADRDRPALQAYHHEVMRESGLVRGSLKAVKLFGALGGAAVGAAIGAHISGPQTTELGSAAAAAVGAAAQQGIEFVLDVAGKLDEDWKPVVFGDWARDYVTRIQTTTRRP